MISTRFNGPGSGALLSFEAAARLRSISGAAEETGMSQSAIGRSIHRLERLLRAKLLAHSAGEMTLTECGEKYLRAVQFWMGRTCAALDTARGQPIGLTIGSSPDFSGLILLPLLSRLNRLLGDDIDARIMVRGPGSPPGMEPAGPAIFFEALVTEHPDENALGVLTEEFVPVASPAFLKRFGGVLTDHPSTWLGVPRLDTIHSGPGWATWETWFGAHGCEPPHARVEKFENYIDLLRAAANGHGVALGWNGFATGYFQTGQLVAIREKWIETKLNVYGVPTDTDKRNQASKACLSVLPRLIAERCTPRPLAVVGEVGCRAY